MQGNPEEDENDYTFTGWVSSCENGTSAICDCPNFKQHVKLPELNALLK